MDRRAPDAEPTATVVLTPARAAELFCLPEADAVVIVGSGCRVTESWLAEYASRLGPLDLTIADCAALTGVQEKTLHRWRERGLMRVRAVGNRRNNILVAPAELVRVLRKSSAERNGTTEVIETPSQTAKRGESDRADALAACDGD